MSTANLKSSLATNGKGFTFSLDTPSLSSGTLDKYLRSVLGTDSANNLPEILRSQTDLSALGANHQATTELPQQPTPSSVSLPPPPPTNTSNSTNQSVLQQLIAKPETILHPPPHQQYLQQLHHHQSQPAPQPVSVQPVQLQSLVHPSTTASSNDNTTSFMGAPPVQVTTAPIDHPSSANSSQSTNDHVPSESSSALTTVNNALATSEGTELVPAPSIKGQQYLDITDYLNMPQSEAARKLNIPPSTLSKRWKEAVRKRKWPFRMVGKIDKEIMTLLHNVPQGPNAPPLPEDIEQALGQLLRRRQEELRPVVIRI